MKKILKNQVVLYEHPVYGNIKVKVYGVKGNRVLIGNSSGTALREVNLNKIKRIHNHKVKHVDIMSSMKNALKETRLRLLREADKEERMESTNDSLDVQVDKYLAQYEKDASKKNESYVRRLYEKKDEDEGDDSDDDKIDVDDIVDDESEDEKLSSKNIDVEIFANNVARLINNYDNLLEVRNTILRRACNFLRNTYDEVTVANFENVMLDQHGIEDGKTKEEVVQDNTIAPPAERAGGGGGMM